MNDVIFSAWCVLINGMTYYAEADFLLRFCRGSRKQISNYVALNVVLTMLAIWTGMFVTFSLLHIALLFFFSVRFFSIPASYVTTPAMIIFTLSTFREGFVAVIMQFLSGTLTSQSLGVFFQFALPLASGALFFLTLRLIAQRYPRMNEKQISSYLYILLLPSALIIAGMRTSLGLDSHVGKFSQGALVAGNPATALYALLWMTGTLLVFFVIIEVFHKVILLSGQEMEHALLISEMKEQRNYIDEARQRNESYRSFQHDINNHLLVLSGLISSQNYLQAKEYLQKLNVTANGLSQEIASGNLALDVLLREKIHYAKQNGISVTCDVQIPRESTIDDIDLCILFANGLDNAIKAAADAEAGHRTITVSAKPKHAFLLIEMVNEISCPAPIVYGTGLTNIELTARKYAGTMRTEQADSRFFLSILLCYKK